MRKLYPLFFLSLFVYTLQAQEHLSVKGAVTVQPDGLLYVQGNVKVYNGGTLDVQSNGATRGKLHVNADGVVPTGTWECDGTVTTTGTGEGGEVKFLGGAVDYEVSGSSVSFPNLVLDFGTIFLGVNDGKMTLEDSITVTHNLEFSDDENDGGKIVTGSNEVYIANADPEAIKSIGSFGFGGNKTKYVEGTLRREIQNPPTANSYYRFPIGSENLGYNPASIDLRDSINPEVPAGVTSIAGRFIEEANPGVININTVTTGNCYFTTAIQYLEFFWMIKNYGYWAFGPNSDTTGNWNYDFYAFPDVDHVLSQNGNLTHMKVFKAPDSFTPGPTADWSQFLFASGDLCNGVNFFGNEMHWIPDEYIPFAQTDSIAAWGLSSFSRFGLGAGTGAGLPITLLFLKATPVDNKFIMVDWATETEINNDFFEVLRSTDGINFTKIGEVDGAGNSQTTLAYQFPDRDVVPNQIYYYRLRQVDFDGSSKLTYIVDAMITSSAVFTVGEFFPNPATDNSRIDIISSEERKINFTMYNTLGQVIRKFDQLIVPGTNHIEFHSNLLADGTYYAIIKSNNEVYSRKLVLTK